MLARSIAVAQHVRAGARRVGVIARITGEGIVAVAAAQSVGRRVAGQWVVDNELDTNQKMGMLFTDADESTSPTRTFLR